ncbi:hypothetical protein R6U79_12050 [Pseudomonas putida]|uniref:hypothetical protein n=1 Tax=Pseudomonas TaxID=286 RepID=UPI0023E355C0|nr:hypothetical protein [Pseudomonas putida]MDF3928132.1 hypothetical protein [Pseudomonas putida]WPK02940.1 hypothetical protein R6U79_12050 [Pseudomonas putida]
MKLPYILFSMTCMATGCVSMDAVQEYTTNSKDTLASTNLLAKDFYNSCTRSNSYKPFMSRSHCDEERKASESIIKVSAVLDAYSTALGAISSDELVDYNADTQKLTRELKSLNKVDPNKIDSTGKLSAVIAKAATDAYRQKNTAELIKMSDSSVGEVADALADLIEQNYQEAITLELDAWEKSFKRIEKSERDKNPLTWETYSESQWQYRSNLQSKLSSSKVLSNSIRSIGATHHKLKTDAENLTGAEVHAAVRSFINEARPAIKDVQSAFSKQ